VWLYAAQLAHFTNGEVAFGRDGRKVGLHAELRAEFVTFAREGRGYTKSRPKVRVSVRKFIKNKDVRTLSDAPKTA
jgi:hypothetical protein